MLRSMRRIALLVGMVITLNAVSLHAQEIADTDGIPANCEADSTYANPNLFPRYNGVRLVLADWSSGAEVLVLEESSAAPDFWFVGWSPDCHYLAGGLGDGERYTTFVWDALTGARMGAVEDAFQRPHLLTWSPRSDSLVVETRHGAFLWDLVTGNRLQLTLDSVNGRSFIQIIWNYETRTLETLNQTGLPIAFSLDTGRPTNIPLADNEYISSRSYSPGFRLDTVTAPTESAPYGCLHVVIHSLLGWEQTPTVSRWVALPNIFIREMNDQLLLRDTVSGETLQVLDANYGMAVRGGWAYGVLSPNCDMFFTLFIFDRETYRRTGIVLRLSDSTRIHAIPNMPSNYRGRQEWDATGRYLFAQSYDGAQIWDSVTDTSIYLTSAEESQDHGFSVDRVEWDTNGGRVTIILIGTGEVRVFDLASGQRVA